MSILKALERQQDRKAGAGNSERPATAARAPAGVAVKAGEPPKQQYSEPECWADEWGLTEDPFQMYRL